MLKKIIVFLILIFLTTLFVNQVKASCFVDEGPTDICYPPQTQNDCSCISCWTLSAKGSCNYRGDPNGELMEFVGYNCNAGECAGDPCPLCSGSCFLSGTKVATPGGKMAIEKVKVGDKVMSFDPATQKQSVNTVAKNFVRESDSYYIIKTASGKEIRVTGEHPFYVGKSSQENLSFLEKVKNIISTAWKYFKVGVGDTFRQKI